MDTRWLNAALGGSALVLSMLLAAPAACQDVRFEYGGQAHTESEIRDLLMAATRHALGPPPAGWAHVVVFRSGADGSPVMLRGDGADLVPLSGNDYVVVAVPAGTHHFGMGTSADLAVEVTPGQPYFVRASGGDDTPVLLRHANVSAFDRARRIAGY